MVYNFLYIVRDVRIGTYFLFSLQYVCALRNIPYFLHRIPLDSAKGTDRLIKDNLFYPRSPLCISFQNYFK